MQNNMQNMQNMQTRFKSAEYALPTLLIMAKARAGEDTVTARLTRTESDMKTHYNLFERVPLVSSALDTVTRRGPGGGHCPPGPGRAG